MFNLPQVAQKLNFEENHQILSSVSSNLTVQLPPPLLLPEHPAVYRNVPQRLSITTPVTVHWVINIPDTTLSFADYYLPPILLDLSSLLY